MKAIKYIAVIAVALLSTYNLNAQSKKQVKTAEVKNLVNSKNFTFVAQYANPVVGGHRYLNYDYSFKVKPDSIIAYLPYFGEVTFDPPVYPTDDGIKFTSTKFGYNMVTKKNGNYEIRITPKDAKYIQQIYLTVSSEGYSYLQFIITNRSAISFDGYITDSNEGKQAGKNAQQTAKVNQ